MTDQPKATEVLDPALEKIKWGLEKTLRARDAEIRALKAALEEMMLLPSCSNFSLKDGKVVYEWMDAYEDWNEHVITSPALVAYLCERNDWPNPLENTNE